MELTQSVSVAEVAGEVRAWLGRRQRSGRSVALELGWTEIYLSRRLTGKVPFDVADLAALAELLEVPVGMFFEIPGGLKRAPIRYSAPQTPHWGARLREGAPGSASFALYTRQAAGAMTGSRGRPVLCRSGLGLAA